MKFTHKKNQKHYLQNTQSTSVVRVFKSVFLYLITTSLVRGQKVEKKLFHNSVLVVLTWHCASLHWYIFFVFYATAYWFTMVQFHPPSPHMPLPSSWRSALSHSISGLWAAPVWAQPAGPGAAPGTHCSASCRFWGLPSLPPKGLNSCQ